MVRSTGAVYGQGPQAPSKKSRSFTPTSPLSSKSAGQSPFGGHGPQAPSKKSRSFTPTSPLLSKSAGQGGAPPTDPQLDKGLGILEQHMIDWKFSTLDRGTMDNSLFADCNCNGVPDSDDIAGGDSDDNNGNGIPDECECPWDLDGSGDVGVKDLLFLLGAWGPCPKKGDCLADFDNTGDVGVKDLLVLLGAWGPCP